MQRVTIYISITALVISATSFYLSYFYKSASLISKVDVFGEDFSISNCTDENNTGPCLEYKISVESLLINSGNMPATITGAHLKIMRFGKEEACESGFQSIGMGGHSNIVGSLNTKSDTRSAEGYIFLSDAGFKGSQNNIVQFCIEYEGVDNHGHYISGKDNILSVNVEKDKTGYLTHWSIISPTIEVD